MYNNTCISLQNLSEYQQIPEINKTKKIHIQQKCNIKLITGFINIT